MIRQVVGTLFDVADRFAQREKKEKVGRPYLCEPLRTSDPTVAENLVKMIESGTGVPLVPSTGDDLGKLHAFCRRARLEVTTQKTTPKPAFEVARWQHIQASDINDELVCTGSAGSALLVCLDPKENRRHFPRAAAPTPPAHRGPSPPGCGGYNVEHPGLSVLPVCWGVVDAWGSG